MKRLFYSILLFIIFISSASAQKKSRRITTKEDSTRHDFLYTLIIKSKYNYDREMIDVDIKDETVVSLISDVKELPLEKITCINGNAILGLLENPDLELLENLDDFTEAFIKNESKRYKALSGNAKENYEAVYKDKYFVEFHEAEYLRACRIYAEEFPALIDDRIMSIASNLFKNIMTHEKDPSKRSKYLNEMMSIMDFKIKYLSSVPKKTVGGYAHKKAAYYLEYSAKPSVNELYNIYSTAVAIDKEKATGECLSNFVKYSVLKCNNDSSHKGQLTEDYLTASRNIDVQIKSLKDYNFSNSKYPEMMKERIKSQLKLLDIYQKNIEAYMKKCKHFTASDLFMLGISVK